MSVFLVVFRQVCVMALLIAIGWLMARRNLLTKEGNAQLSRLLTDVITPLVVFRAFVTLEASLENLQLLGVTFALFGFSFGFSILVALVQWRRRNEQTAVNRMCTVFNNYGFFGIPVLQALFGDMGVFYASISVIYCNVLMWTWGPVQFDSGKRKSLREILRLPCAAATLAGLALFALRLIPGVQLVTGSAFVQEAGIPVLAVLDSIKALNTPIAMFVLGVNIFHAHWSADRQLLGIIPRAFQRQILMPLVILLLILWLPVDRTLILSVFVTASCPIAMLTSVAALRYSKSPTEPDRATHIVVFSTLSSLVTVPLMVALGNWIVPL